MTTLPGKAAQTPGRVAPDLWQVLASPTLVGAILGVVFAAWISAALPWWAIYMMNPDEGFNLGKAALLLDGWSLYGQLWNDQPPVLTYALALVQLVFPGDVAAGRALVLASAVVTVVSLYRLCHRAGGHTAALMAVLLLATVPLFMSLSVSVMIGLPAIALAVVAMDVASSPIRSGLVRNVLAGLVMALSLQTKLFTFTALPALLWLVWAQGSAGVGQRVRAVAILAASTLIGFALIVVISGEPLFQQLIGTHLSGQLRKSYDLAGSATTIWRTLKPAWPLLVGLGAGLVIGWRRLLGPGVAPALWLIVAAVSLAGHTPVWDHQVLLLVVPMTWLAGIGLSALPALTGAPIAGTALAALIGLSGWNAVPAVQRPNWQHDPGFAAEAALKRFSGLGKWVLNDMAVDAFRAGKLNPPETAVLSAKRVLQGAASAEDIVVVLKAYQPDQALFRRFALGTFLEDYLEANYWQVPSPATFRHYVRKGAALDGFDRTAALAGLTDMLKRMEATNVEGGYAGVLDPVTGQRFERTASSDPLPERAIVMRPSGSTPRLGQCMLRAGRLADDTTLIEAAVRAGEAAVCAQSSDGGWPASPELSPLCSAVTPPVSPRSVNRQDVLDEGGPAQAISFLLSLRSVAPQQADRFTRSARAALDFLVNAQNPDGGWPIWLRPGSYSHYSTLNDGVTTAAIGALADGFGLFGDPRYRESAIKGVQFLLDRQDGSGAWAQQYDAEGKPAKARAFEPASFASLESGRAMLTLADFYVLTEDPVLRTALLAGRDWLKQRQLPDQTWSRLYEIGTNRPIFGDRDGSVHYDISEISEERRTGYTWLAPFAEAAGAISLADAAEAGPSAVRFAKARWQRDQQAIRVTENHDKLVAFSRSGGAGAELDENGMISTRKAVEACEMVLDALEISGI